MTETKKYCCSSRPPLEAVNCGTLDLIMSLIAFISTAVLTYFYTSKPDSLQAAAHSFGTVKRLVLLKESTQSGILIGFFLITGMKAIHATLLLFGSISQNSLLLKLWIIFCIPIGLVTSAAAFFLAYFAHEKLLFGFIALFYVLFQVYTIWIIREYAVELRSVSVSESQCQLQLKSTSAATMEDEEESLRV